MTRRFDNSAGRRALDALVGTMLLALAATTGLAGNDAAPLFAAQATLEVTLEGPLDAVTDDRRDDAPYRPAVLRYLDPATGAEVSLDVGLRTRGNYRRRKETCSFPPLRINFKKKQVDGTLFAGQNKLKLVTHCGRSEKYTRYVLNEYLAYRTLNVLTGRSLRARLLKVRYLFQDKKNRVEESYAFVLEPQDQMAARNGAQVRRAVKIGHSQLDGQYSNLIEVFQFMIANTDWSMIRGDEPGDCCHNFILITADDTLFHSVPYDFDFSGVVNAPYAEPHPDMKIKSVRSRLYRGRCRPEPMLADTIAHFNDSRAAIYALYDKHPVLGEKRAAQTLRYYDAFYAIVNNPKKRHRYIDKRCFAAN